MSRVVTIGIAEMGIAKVPDSLITYALGSCVGVCLYDKNLKLAGMVHIMLPEAVADGKNTSVARYANTGVPELVNQMEKMGASRTRMVAKIAGGARMFDIPGDSLVGNIGDRNQKAVMDALAMLRIPIAGKDLGADYARTMSFNTEDGMVTIKAFSKGTSVW